MDWYLTDPLDSRTRKENWSETERSRGWSIAIVLVVAGILELSAVRAAVSVSVVVAVSVAVAVSLVVRGRELWGGCVTAVVGRAAGSRPAASGDKVVSARRVIGRRRAEARAELASSVASSAATVSGPAGIAVVVFVSVSEVSRAGTGMSWSSVVSGTGGATVMRPAVSRWSRGSSMVLRPSVSCGAREVWTCGASVVWSAVSEVAVRGTAVIRTVMTSQTSEGRVRWTSVVGSGLTESGNAVRRVRGTSVCRWSVEPRTTVVRGTSVIWSSVSDTRHSGTSVCGTASVTSGAVSGSFIGEATVSRSCVIAEATVRDVPVRNHSYMSGTMVGGTGVGATGSSCKRAGRGGRGKSVSCVWT